MRYLRILARNLDICLVSYYALAIAKTLVVSTYVKRIEAGTTTLLLYEQSFQVFGVRRVKCTLQHSDRDNIQHFKDRQKDPEASEDDPSTSDEKTSKDVVVTRSRAPVGRPSGRPRRTSSRIHAAAAQPKKTRQKAVEKDVTTTQYLCPVCDLIYQSQNMQTTHLERYHWQSGVEYGGGFQCVLCPVTKPSIQEIAEHARTHQNETMFKCGICLSVMPPDKGFRSRHSLENHRARRVRPRVPHICTHCDKEMFFPSELAYHLLTEHDETAMTVQVKQSKDYECNYCNQTFSKTKLLYHHIKTSHGLREEDDDVSVESEGEDGSQSETKPTREELDGIESVQYLCPVCDVSYQSSCRQATHFQRFHWEAKPDGTLQCNSCTETKNNLKDMVTHARSHRDKLYTCDSCPVVLPIEKIFRRKHYMQEHKSGRTQPKKLHQCEQCQEELPTLSGLAYHSLMQHDNTLMTTRVNRKPHQCNYCDQSFVNLTALIKHIGTSHDEQDEDLTEDEKVKIEPSELQQAMEKPTRRRKRTKLNVTGPPFICDPCHKEYKSASSYLAHMRYYCGKSREEKQQLKKEKSYLCSLCGTVLTSYSGFQTHMANHYDRHKFKCDLCAKAFAKRGQLNFHRRTHSRPFICQSCGKRFKTLSHLKDHQITHSDEMNYTCPSCPERFKWRPTLVRHLYKVHGQGAKPDSSSRRKMLCLLCNMRVNSGKRTKHFQRRHKDLVYDLKYFQLVSASNTTAAAVASENVDTGTAQTLLVMASTPAIAPVTVPQMHQPPQQQVIPIELQQPHSTPMPNPIMSLAQQTSVGIPLTTTLTTAPPMDQHYTQHILQEVKPLEPDDPSRHVAATTTTYLTPAYTTTMMHPVTSAGHAGNQPDEGVTFDVVSMQAAIDAHHQQQPGHYQVIQDAGGVPVVIQPHWQ